jgi:hypothetical protein
VENDKSQAMLAFEARLTDLENRMERGEVGLLEAASEFGAFVNEARGKVTEAEWQSLLELQLDAHRIGAQILAEHGTPVPGNDPNRPN